MPATTNKVQATLGGQPILMRGNISWSLREGVQPSTGKFFLAPADAQALVAGGGGPFDLVITPPEGNPVIVTNLWVLNIEPGPNAYISAVTVADRRWFWSYGHIIRRYNMRRNIGIKRILANDEFAVAFDRAPEVQYWKWSLDGNHVWVPVTMATDLMSRVAEIENEFHGETFNVVLDELVGSRIRNLPIEELTIDDPGDAAVRRMLTYLPEAGITVDYDGTVVIFARASGREKEIAEALMPEIWEEGHTDLVKNNLIRPKEVHVLFTREVELRFDFIEEVLAARATITDEPLGELRRMENVLPLPDYQLTVNGRTLVRDTWITMDDAFRAWGNLPIQGVTRALDHDMVQRAFIPEMGLWTILQLAGQRPDGQGDLANWPGRVAAVEAHYRQTFRINRRWMDRMLSLRDYRLATIDPQSGQRGPARAYGDYAVLYTQRSLWRNHAQGKPFDWAINRSAFPTGGNFDRDAEPSPAVVRVVDHDMGVIQVDYVGTNPLSGDTRTVLPSTVFIDSMPTSDLRNPQNRPLTWDMIHNAINPPRLSPAFRLAVILTVVPASPNSEQQLHRVVIKPGDIRGLLPPSQTNGLDDAKGPVMEIRIGADVEVARVQWKDDKSAEIEKIFGLTEGTPDLTGLVLNEGPDTDLAKGASINQIARARAAAIYASLVDRYEGEMTGYMNGGVRLVGWADEIIHSVDARGVATTRLAFPPDVPQMSLFSFLDSNSRAAILRLVQPL